MLLKLQIQRVSNFPSTLGEAVLHCKLRAPLQHTGWKLLLTELKVKMQHFSFLFPIAPFACLHLPGRPDSYVQISAQDGQRARGAFASMLQSNWLVGIFQTTCKNYCKIRGCSARKNSRGIAYSIAMLSKAWAPPQGLPCCHAETASCFQLHSQGRDGRHEPCSLHIEAIKIIKSNCPPIPTKTLNCTRPT